VVLFVDGLYYAQVVSRFDREIGLHPNSNAIISARNLIYS